jgi:hypothetical protein
MKRIGMGLTVLGALLAGATGALAWTPDAQLERELVRGDSWAEVLPAADGAGLIHAAIDIAAPPRTVWAVMTDCKMAARLVSSVTSCRIMQGDQRSGWDIREQVTKANFFVPTIRNVFRSDYQPYSLIRFHRTSGDLRIEEGEWRLSPINGGAGTEVTYVNHIAANIVAPAFIVRASMKKDTPKVLLNLRRESLAAARKSVGT